MKRTREVNNLANIFRGLSIRPTNNVNNLTKKFKRMTIEPKKNVKTQFAEIIRANPAMLRNVVYGIRRKYPTTVLNQKTRQKIRGRIQKRLSNIDKEFQNQFRRGAYLLPSTTSIGHTGIVHPLNIVARRGNVKKAKNDDLLVLPPQTFQRMYGMLNDKRKTGIKRILNTVYSKVPNNNRNKQNYVTQRRRNGNANMSNASAQGFQKRLYNKYVKGYENIRRRYGAWKNDPSNANRTKSLLLTLNTIPFYPDEPYSSYYREFNTNFRNLMKSKNIKPNHPYLVSQKVNIRKPMNSFRTLNNYKAWVKPIVRHVYAESVKRKKV